MNISFKPIWVGVVSNLLAIYLIWLPGRASVDHNLVFDIRFAYLATFIIFGLAGYYLNRKQLIKDLTKTSIILALPVLAFVLFTFYKSGIEGWFVVIFLPLTASIGFISGAKLALKQFQWLAYSAVGLIAFVLVYVPNANNLLFINLTNAHQNKMRYHHLITANGQPIDSAALQGKVVIMEWLGTTIDSELISRKQAAYKKYAGNPNVVLCFAMKGQPQTTPKLPQIWYDDKGNFSKYFIDPAEQLTYIIDKKGIVQWRNGKVWGFSEDPFVFVGAKDRWIELSLTHEELSLK